MEENTSILEIQFALFFKEILKEPDLFATTIREKINSIFDQTPLIVPVPNDPPLYEVPVAQMNSRSGRYACNIARSRIDFFVKSDKKSNFLDLKNEVTTNILEIFKLLPQDIKVKRVAVVSRFFVIENKAFTIISDLFDSDLKKIFGGGQVSNSLLQYAVKNKYKASEIFDNVLIQQGVATIKNFIQDEKGVLITRDFNTNNEIDYSSNITEQFISEFIEYAEANLKIDKILDKLWSQSEVKHKK